MAPAARAEYTNKKNKVKKFVSEFITQGIIIKGKKN